MLGHDGLCHAWRYCNKWKALMRLALSTWHNNRTIKNIKQTTRKSKNAGSTISPRRPLRMRDGCGLNRPRGHPARSL